MKYKVNTYDYTASLLDNVLINRGIKKDDIEDFLDLSVEEQNPLLFSNLKRGCAQLYEHIKKGSRIAVVVDEDIDGFCSSSVLIQYLVSKYQNLDIHYILQKDNKAHGLNKYIISKVEEIGANLVICPDSSSNDVYFHSVLLSSCIDIMVIDHHEVEEEVDSRVVLINNHLPNEVNKYISAVGVVYIFIKYYNSIVFGDECTEMYLDLVAFALVADSCDMRDIYTRKLTYLGFGAIKNSFFKELIKSQEYKVKSIISIMTISFYIAPILNACIRMSSLEDRSKVFDSLTYGNNIEEAIDLCVKAKSKQDRIRDREFKSLVQKIEEKKLDRNGAIIVIKNDITPSIVGLVSNKISDRYNKPSIILRQVQENIYSGSARNCIDEFDFKAWCNGTNKFIYNRGHANAFGSSISIDGLANLDSDLETLSSQLGETIVEVDKEYSFDTICEKEIIELIENADLWGNKLKEPIFAIKNIPLYKSSVSILGKKKNTIKFSSSGFEYLIFNADDKIKEDFDRFNTFRVNALVKFAKNNYKGNVSLQCKIEDYEIVEEKRMFF